MALTLDLVSGGELGTGIRNLRICRARITAYSVRPLVDWPGSRSATSRFRARLIRLGVDDGDDDEHQDQRRDELLGRLAPGRTRRRPAAAGCTCVVLADPALGIHVVAGQRAHGTAVLRVKRPLLAFLHRLVAASAWSARALCLSSGVRGAAEPREAAGPREEEGRDPLDRLVPAALGLRCAWAWAAPCPPRQRDEPLMSSAGPSGLCAPGESWGRAVSSPRRHGTSEHGPSLIPPTDGQRTCTVVAGSTGDRVGWNATSRTGSSAV